MLTFDVAFDWAGNLLGASTDECMSGPYLMDIPLFGLYILVDDRLLF